VRRILNPPMSNDARNNETIRSQVAGKNSQPDQRNAI